MSVVGFINIQERDYDGEIGRTSLRTANLSAANFTAQGAARAQFMLGLWKLTKGADAGYDYGTRNILTLDKASDPTAQRELKWLVSCHDTTTLHAFSFTLPCADTAYLDPNRRDHANMAHADVINFKARTEAYILSPDGNPIVIDEITLVGRRV